MRHGLSFHPRLIKRSIFGPNYRTFSEILPTNSFEISAYLVKTPLVRAKNALNSAQW
jgi:hypothetical protein